MNPTPRTCIVTGASRGLGRAIAIALGQAGHHVIVNYHQSREGALETISLIQSAGGEAHAIQADVCDDAEVSRLVRETESRYGAPEVLVNNATGAQPMKPLEDYRWQDFEDQLNFFVKAPHLLMQATVAKMKAARFGRVIMIGSEVVDLGNANFSAYVAAKGAQFALARAWASELGPWQITVNNIHPGWIPVERHGIIADEARRAYTSGVPLGRQGVPNDIGATVSFLASDAANFITGQVLAVNGGNTF